jgi:hypothetical protein
LLGSLTSRNLQRRADRRTTLACSRFDYLRNTSARSTG